MDGTSDLEKEIRDLRKSIKFQKDSADTVVYAIAISKDPNLNKRIEISAAYGSPVTHEVYNTIRDCLFVSGVDAYELGFIPVSYRISIEDCDWDCCVPLPFSLLKRHLSKEQLTSFNKWKSAYKSDSFDIQFVQTVSAF